MEGYSWGGSEELWVEMALVALANGHQIEASVKHWGTPNSKLDQLKKMGAVIHFRRKSVLQRASNKIAFNLGISSYSSFFDSYVPDLTLITEGSAFEFTKNLYWTNFALDTSFPYCFIIQNVFESESLNNERRKRALSVYKKAKALYFVSQRNIEVAQRQLAYEFSNAIVVNNPVSIPKVKSSLASLSENDTIINFASVGRLDCHSKGQDILLQVLSMPAWKTRNWHLNIYGIGQDYDHLVKLATFYQVNDKVSFQKYIPATEIWQTNHLLIMPSYNEGTSLALLEAMSFGIPAVVTNVGGLAEWIEDEVNGFVAAAPTVNLLAQTLEKCWQMKPQWLEIGLRSREKIISRYPRSAGDMLFERIRQL